jgi:aminocarboxymuconate-semialdehyde decarboxylase
MARTGVDDSPSGLGGPPALAEPPAIDVHTHAMPLPVLRKLERDGLADLSRVGAGAVHIDPRVSGMAASVPIPCVPEQYDVDARLHRMDEAGVAVHLISAPPFVSGCQLADPVAAATLMRHTNDALAALAVKCPDRLRPLAVVLPGLPDAVAEARRCREELGFAGVCVGSRGMTGELDHPDHEPLWHYLAGTGTFTLLHPAGSPAPGRLADLALTQALGFPLETSLAAARLILGGVLDRYDLRVCLCHAGGCVPAVIPRLDLDWHRRPAARTTAHPPSGYLTRFYYDTAMSEAGRLRRLVDEVGSDRVLLGSDAPFGLADREPRRTIAALGLAAADEQRILGGTAAGLLPRPPVPAPGGVLPPGPA